MEEGRRMSFFQAFVKFRDRYRGWGGKEQFKKYYKKIRVRKGEKMECFVLKCMIAKMLEEQRKPFLCDVKIGEEVVDVFDVEEFKKYIVRGERIPKEVSDCVQKIQRFLQEEVF